MHVVEQTIYGVVPGTSVSLGDLLVELAALDFVYPGFESWFSKKVVPGMGSTRSIFVKMCDSGLEGVVIAKADEVERKLCTVWIAPSCRGRGLGTALMMEAMDWLECDRPLISVPAERMTEFSTSFSRWGFIQTQALEDHYRPGHTEYVFNGLLNCSLRS